MSDYRRVLSWGGPGSGKTTFGCSSFYDFDTNTDIDTGRLIYIGGESNPDLGLPADFIKHFPLNMTNPMKMAEDIKKYLQTLAAAATRGKGVNNVVFDGLSEYNLDAEYGFDQSDRGQSDNWFSWRSWRTLMLETIQLLNPQILRANVFCTARIGKRKEKDADWMSNFEYIPLMDGYWREQMGHYFNYVVYHGVTYKEVMQGKNKIRDPQWISYWLPIGEYLVKNGTARRWPRDQAILTNATWPQVTAIIDAISSGKEVLTPEIESDIVESEGGKDD